MIMKTVDQVLFNELLIFGAREDWEGWKTNILILADYYEENNREEDAAWLRLMDEPLDYRIKIYPMCQLGIKEIWRRYEVYITSFVKTNMSSVIFQYLTGIEQLPFSWCWDRPVGFPIYSNLRREKSRGVSTYFHDENIHRVAFLA